LLCWAQYFFLRQVAHISLLANFKATWVNLQTP
jgi:hypothetical protein